MPATALLPTVTVLVQTLVEFDCTSETEDEAPMLDAFTVTPLTELPPVLPGVVTTVSLVVCPRETVDGLAEPMPVGGVAEA